jgi:hypothetical protein
LFWSIYYEKTLLFCLVAALSISVYSADGIDNSFNKWVLDSNTNTLSYKGWVFNTAGSMDALKITSVSSYVAEGKTDIDFSTIYEDTGATVVELGGSLLASYPGKQGNFVGTVILAPSIETIGVNLCVYGGVTNFVFPPNSRLTKIPNQLLLMLICQQFLEISQLLETSLSIVKMLLVN